MIKINCTPERNFKQKVRFWNKVQKGPIDDCWEWLDWEVADGC